MGLEAQDILLRKDVRDDLALAGVLGAVARVEEAAYADALRDEEAQHGVRVTTVYPGRTATPMQQKVRAQEGGAYDPGEFIDPATVASTIRFVLEAPRDATLPDVSVRPGPR